LIVHHDLQLETDVPKCNDKPTEQLYVLKAYNILNKILYQKFMLEGS